MVYGLNVQPEWIAHPKIEILEGGDGPIPALKPVKDGGVGGASRTGGVPVDGANFPKRVSWTDPHGNPVPDFDATPHLNVSERAKQIIESVEPGIHQFFPVAYVVNGQSDGIRYWFVPCNRIDSLDRDHTTMVLRKGNIWRPASDLVRRGEAIPPHIDPTQPAKMVFNLKAIGNRHIWSDKHIGGAGYFISDKMADAFREVGLTGLQLDQSQAEAV